MSSRPPIPSSPNRVLSAGPRQGRKTKDPDRERFEDRERVEELQKQVEDVLKENSLTATGRRNFHIIVILLIIFTVINFSLDFGYTEVRLKTQREEIKSDFEKKIDKINKENEDLIKTIKTMNKTLNKVVRWEEKLNDSKGKDIIMLKNYIYLFQWSLV